MFYILFLLLAHFHAMADIIGNGGDVVVCNSSTQPPVELLDHYEGREMYGFALDLGDTELSLEQKFSIFIERLENFSPLRAQRYRLDFQNFMNEATFKHGITLTDIPDSAHLFLPAGCHIEQIAIQRNPTANESRYLINADLWDQLSNNGKIGLILHEIIYREALEHGHTDSIFTRYLNAWISADSFESTSLATFNNTLSTNKFLTPLLYSTIYLDAKNIYYYSDGTIYAGRVLKSSYIYLNNEKVFLSGFVSFDKNGYLIKIQLEERLNMQVLGRPFFVETPNIFGLQTGYIELYPSGKIKRVPKLQGGDKVFFQNKERQVNTLNPYLFHESGVPYGLNLINDEQIQFLGQTVTVHSITLNEQAEVIFAGLEDPIQVEVQGHQLSVNWISVYNPSAIEAVELKQPAVFNVSNQNVELAKNLLLFVNGNIRASNLTQVLNVQSQDKQFLVKSGEEFDIPIGTKSSSTGPSVTFELHPSNNLKCGTLASQTELLVAGVNRQFAKNSFIAFYANGNLRSGIPAEPMSILVQNKPVTVTTHPLSPLESEVKFFQNGHLRQAVIGEDVVLNSTEGNVLIKKHSFVTFDQNGLVTKVVQNYTNWTHYYYGNPACFDSENPELFAELQ